MPDSELTLFLRLLRRTIDEYLAEVEPNAAPAREAASPSRTPATEEPRHEASMPSANGARHFEDVREVMMRELVSRTGYPEEMLELDLDLEGDLGIDTVKQVAVLAAVREQFGLEIDPAFRLREQNTLRKAITYIARRLDTANR